MVKIGFKFCGQCNPKIDIKDIYYKIISKFYSENFYFISDTSVELDLIIVLNACGVCCAKTDRIAERVIVISPDGVNFWPIDSEQLLDQIMKVISITINELTGQNKY